MKKLLPVIVVLLLVAVFSPTCSSQQNEPDSTNIPFDLLTSDSIQKLAHKDSVYLPGFLKFFNAKIIDSSFFLSKKYNTTYYFVEYVKPLYTTLGSWCISEDHLITVIQNKDDSLDRSISLEPFKREDFLFPVLRYIHRENIFEP